MATNYNIEMKRFNGTDDDTLYPVPANHADSHKTGGSDALTATDIGASKIAKVGTMTLPADEWSAHYGYYYTNRITIAVPPRFQNVDYKIDLQMNPSQIKQLIDDKVAALFAYGNTVYAVGEKPSQDLLVQYTFVEVGV